ncbi:hypothetical protein DO97_07795 [Neosynechococcus sphagnicola sy1]|uniref:DUF3082 domain-containing protein n=1 Tax=Neosynechococcus sphagnicola sy1 TaxID=1497020 RepID=A0A098TL54_9CYAN|nr:DUF3082 domain-containing protein [Neosynechococcus sphagnicola]KGF72567.1 hypothetical protein DO97_07795 [Neosynechococcus sphagnicola sy1]
MTNPTPTPPSSNSAATLPNPWHCLGGSLVSGAIAFGMYHLTLRIALRFAHQGLHSHNMIVINITVALRTLIVGLSALGTGIFGLVSLGLLGLGLQVLQQRLRPTPPDSASEPDAEP